MFLLVVFRTRVSVGRVSYLSVFLLVVFRTCVSVGRVSDRDCVRVLIQLYFCMRFHIMIL